ncbi:MAG: diguanylate cyclase [Planctomycetota bacterium]
MNEKPPVPRSAETSAPPRPGRLATVGTYMSRTVVAVAPKTPLVEACRLMADRRIGSVVVVGADNVPVGIVSERDVVRRFAKRQTLGVPVGQVMARPLITAAPGEQALLALERMRQRHIRRLVVVDDDGKLSGIITQTDVLEASRRTLAELADRHVRLAEAARRDDLTGLFNRRAFNNFSQIELGRTRRYGGLLALVLFDLDHFKRVNDVHGHETGDGVLRVFAELLKANCREVDIAARYGGEEFLVLMPAVGTRAAAIFAERVRKELEAREIHAADGRTFRVTASAGVCKWSLQNDSLRVILRRADEALYKAKNTGRNRVCVAADAPPARMKGPRHFA